MIVSYLSGLYDKPAKIENMIKGVFTGTVLILLIYSLLDVNLRFSRALIIIGALWALVVFFTVRLLFKRFDFGKSTQDKKRFIIVGDDHEQERVKDILLHSSDTPPEFIGFVSLGNTKSNNENTIGTFNQLEEIIRIYSVTEVIFCSKNMSAAEIIDNMSQLKQTGVDMKIAPADSIFIIGSNSINAKGDVYMMNINNIDKPENKRNKRTLDVIISLFFICLIPVFLWFMKRPFQWVINNFLVLSGLRTWVGYADSGIEKKLPSLRKGILSPMNQFESTMNPDNETVHNLNILYARDYKISKDLIIILKGFSYLGNS